MASGSIMFMDGYDYLPPAPVSGSQLQAWANADGWFAVNFGNGSSGMFPQTGRFGIGSAICLSDPPGGVGALRSLDHRFGGVAGSEGWIAGFAFVSFGSNSARFRHWDGQTNTFPFDMQINTSGVLTLGISGSTYRSRTGAIRNNIWSFVQVKLTKTILRVLVNGEIVINTASPPPIQPFDSFAFNNGYSTGRAAFDDHYIIDLDVPGPYDDFLGNIVVRSQLAIANGSVIKWNPHGLAANWQNVATAQMVAANYNDTDVVGDYDLYTMNPNAAARDIFGIQVKGSYAQDNGVQLYAANRIKTGGVEFTGAQFGVTQLPGYQTIANYYQLNPDTGVAWTNADLNALEAGPVLAASD